MVIAADSGSRTAGAALSTIKNSMAYSMMIRLMRSGFPLNGQEEIRKLGLLKRRKRKMENGINLRKCTIGLQVPENRYCL